VELHGKAPFIISRCSLALQTLSQALQWRFYSRKRRFLFVAKTTGNQQLVVMLRDYGVSHVFFVPTIRMTSFALMESMGIRRILTHGEKAAAYMADGYARAAHRPGICMAQHIGASNLAAGLRDPYMSCSPVIAITGGELPNNRYRHAYQDIEDLSQFDPVTKMNCQVEDVRRLPDLLRQAFRVATCGTPGPVHLQLRGLHGQVLDGETDVPSLAEPQYATVPPFRPAPDPEALRRAVDRIAAAQRPIVVAGGGVVTSDARQELVAFCQAFSLPVATSLSAKDCIVDTHPLNVGVPGSYSRQCANQAVVAADLVIFVGCQAGGMVTHFWRVPLPGTPIVQIDINPVLIGRNYPDTVPVVADAKLALAALAALAPAKPPAGREAWLARIRDLKSAWRETADVYRTGSRNPMRPEEICDEVSDLLPADGVLVSDTGHSGIWTGTMVELRHPAQRYFRCGGSLGWGLPGAAGAQSGAVERRRWPLLSPRRTRDGGALRHQCRGGVQQQLVARLRIQGRRRRLWRPARPKLEGNPPVPRYRLRQGSGLARLRRHARDDPARVA
jgi:acetolactate synthase-1/2/3 large subunit